MKEITGTLGKCILLLFIGGLTGTILLILVYLLPVNTENREASFDIIQQEGWYPKASVSIPTKWDFATNHLPFQEELTKLLETVVVSPNENDVIEDALQLSPIIIL